MISSLFLVQLVFYLNAISYFVSSRPPTFPLNFLGRIYLKVFNN